MQVPTGLNPVDVLVAIEDIKQLKARYFRFVDTKDWESLATLFIPECTFAFESSLRGIPALATYASAEEFVRLIQGRQALSKSIHHGHTPEITLTSANHATGIWAMEDIVQRPPGGLPSFVGWGHYLDEYVLVPTGWCFSSVRLIRSREILLADLPASPWVDREAE